MKMEKPTVEAVRFTSADVIATSGQLGVNLSGFGDSSTSDNNTITVGSKNYTPANSVQDVITALQGAGQPSGYDELTTRFIAGGWNKSLDDLWSEDKSDWGVFNGTYKWYNNRWVWSGSN